MAAPKRKNQGALQVARHALSVANNLKAAQEKKYVITVFERSGVINTGAVFLLNETNQDIGDVAARIGDSIRLCRLRFSLKVEQPPALTGAHPLRIVIILDKQNTLANAGGLFIGVGTNHAPMLQYTKDYKLSYAILYDSFPVALDTYNPSKTMRFDIPLRINTRYIQGTDEITTGALKVIFISDVVASSGATYPSVTGTIRVDYTDN